MPDLHLRSLCVQNYRIFKDLQILRLGRVVLLTGKNSAGKTSLLEALRLYAYGGSPRVILEILDDRGELLGFSRSQLHAGDFGDEQLELAAQALFHGYSADAESDPSISIGPVEADARLDIHLSRYALDFSDGPDADLVGPFRRSLLIQTPDGEEFSYDLQGPRRLPQRLQRRAGRGSCRNCVYVPAGGLSVWDLADLWNTIDLTPAEQTVISGLRLVVPSIERISISAGSARFREPVVRAKLTGEPDPVALGSLGDGLTRIFGVTLALVNARDGLLLVDEVENGIHYTLQAPLWRLIFQVALQLNVQVFATTHSYDCIRGFQQAARENPEDGMLIRLNKQADGVTATLFDEEALQVVTEEEIEVR